MRSFLQSLLGGNKPETPVTPTDVTVLVPGMN